MLSGGLAHFDVKLPNNSMLQKRIKRLSEPRIITRAEEWWPTLGHHAMIIYIVSRHGLKMVHYLPLSALKCFIRANISYCRLEESF